MLNANSAIDDKNSLKVALLKWSSLQILCLSCRESVGAVRDESLPILGLLRTGFARLHIFEWHFAAIGIICRNSRWQTGMAAEKCL